MDFIATFFQTFVQTLQLDLSNRSNVLLTQRMEYNNLIYTVDEFRSEVMAHDAQHHIFHVAVIQLTKAFLD